MLRRTANPATFYPNDCGADYGCNFQPHFPKSTSRRAALLTCLIMQVQGGARGSQGAACLESFIVFSHFNPLLSGAIV
jgi:hypothetical protein